MNEGSTPAERRPLMRRAVVVVLPWVPVAPIVGINLVSASSSWGRRQIGIPAASAATNSGSRSGTAEEATTRSTPDTTSG